MYVMNVGLDLRLVNTNTLEVVDVISYQKQIIGRQISAGVFDFLGTNFFDVSAGESALEPIQLAVRSVIERAVLEMVTRIYRVPARRLRLAASTPPPTRWATRRHTAYRSLQPPQPGRPAQPLSIPWRIDNGTSRQNPYRGYSSDDPVGDVRLAGGLTESCRQQYPERPDQPAIAIRRT